MGPNAYRARAIEMRLQAARVRDAKVREQFLLMALDWERLAEKSVATQSTHRPRRRQTAAP